MHGIVWRCSLGFFSLFVWFWFYMRVTFHFLGIIVNTDKKKSVLPTVQLSVHVFFFSFSGSPLTGTLRETPPVSRTKTRLCSMFCVKETSQNGNILRSGVKSQLFKYCFLLSKTIFSITYRIRFAWRFKVHCPTVESDNSYCDKLLWVHISCFFT